MRSISLVLLLLPLIVAGCGSSSSTDAGTIQFGMSEKHDVIQRPTNSFGPDDFIAYVAHVDSTPTLPPHTRIHEYWVRVSADGKEHPVMDDIFALKVPVRGFVTFSSFPIAKFYKVGFTAPGTYRVRLVRGGATLAQGTFYLK